MMLKNFNYSNNNSFSKGDNSTPINHSMHNKLRRDVQEHRKDLPATTETDQKEDLDIFFTLILKNLDPSERSLLLNLLLNINWDDPDFSLDKHIKDLIKRKNPDENTQNTYEYDQFLWQFKNWKNYFSSKNIK